jgi:peptide subunit release factor 1 (eRF1)
MVTKADLANLRDYEFATGHVLSIYLDVNQSDAANLNRAFEASLDRELRVIAKGLTDECALRDFEASAAWARDFVSKYAPNASGLVIYAKANGSLWARELNVPIQTQVCWTDSAFIQPLLEAMDEYQRCGVVLFDRLHARIFTVMLGRIEKYAEAHAIGRVRHLKSAGKDHLYSQARFQRRADECIHAHLKRVEALLEEMIESKPFERLVLAGSPEMTNELQRTLPKWLRSLVVDTVVLPINATDEEVLNTVQRLEQKFERTFELGRVKELLELSGSRNRAIATVMETLQAVNERRIRELIYAEDFPIKGGACQLCGAVYGSSDRSCEYCGVPVKPVDDVIALASTRALASGASIEQLRGEAADRLKVTGGLGAFLRY